MTESRKPFWVKCPKCSHCWAAAYMPIAAALFAKLTRRATCPMCAETKGITITSGEHEPPKAGAIDDTSARLVLWFGSNDTGISSKAIATHMSGGTVGDRWGWGHPHDPDDLGRCLRLLELFPEWKPRIGEMATRSQAWARLVSRWDEIARSMQDEVGIAWEKGRSAPLTYKLMQDVIGRAA